MQHLSYHQIDIFLNLIQHHIRQNTLAIQMDCQNNILCQKHICIHFKCIFVCIDAVHSSRNITMEIVATRSIENTKKNERHILFILRLRFSTRGLALFLSEPFFNKLCYNFLISSRVFSIIFCMICPMNYI